MMFFKRMNKQESANSKRAVEAGFIIYMLLTAINYFCYLFTEKTFFSPTLIFWSGLFVFFGYSLFISGKEKSK